MTGSMPHLPMAIRQEVVHLVFFIRLCKSLQSTISLRVVGDGFKSGGSYRLY